MSLLNLAIYFETDLSSSQDNSGNLISDFLTHELVQHLLQLTLNDEILWMNVADGGKGRHKLTTILQPSYEEAALPLGQALL